MKIIKSTDFIVRMVNEGLAYARDISFDRDIKIYGRHTAMDSFLDTLIYTDNNNVEFYLPNNNEEQLEKGYVGFYRGARLQTVSSLTGISPLSLFIADEEQDLVELRDYHLFGAT